MGFEEIMVVTTGDSIEARKKGLSGFGAAARVSGIEYTVVKGKDEWHETRREMKRSEHISEEEKPSHLNAWARFVSITFLPSLLGNESVLY